MQVILSNSSFSVSGVENIPTNMIRDALGRTIPVRTVKVPNMVGLATKQLEPKLVVGGGLDVNVVDFEQIESGGLGRSYVLTLVATVPYVSEGRTYDTMDYRVYIEFTIYPENAVTIHPLYKSGFRLVDAYSVP